MKMTDLTQADITALKEITKLNDTFTLENFKEASAESRAKEKLLSPLAWQWYSTVPSRRLRAMLAKWIHEYRWERSRCGWRAYRWIGNRQGYALRPCLTEQPEPFNIWRRK